MKKNFTLLIIFSLCSIWNFAQCPTLGTMPGDDCTFSSDGTLTIPTVDHNGDDITTMNITVKAWGAGGSTSGGASANAARNGAGGGAYFTHSYTVNAGATFAIVVGQATATNGGSTTFAMDPGVIVGGGQRGHTTSAGAGGTVTGATGGTSIPGGAGGARQSGATAGGGGGGSGPGNSAGGNGAGGIGGSAGTGGGGAGGNTSADGNPGTTPGGGAGGKGNGGAAALGSNGQVTVCYDAVVLPVELVSFNANAMKDRVLLEWQTASEVNNDGFEIQKSKDGVVWNILDFVEGQGTVSGLSIYESVDKSPTQGANYYRLKQIDFNGKFEYSKIVSVEFYNRLNELKISPNPVKDQLILKNGEGKAIIYNVLGQPVKDLTIDRNQSTIQLAGLLNGQYYLQIVKEDRTIVIKQFSKTY